jgi:selenocysteine lyase/cysteine desulfurase
MSRKLQCQRDLFEIPEGITYLNCAYMGPLSRQVTDAGHAGLERKLHPWKVSSVDFFDEVEAVRSLVATLLNADADGVAILPAVSYGVAIAAQNLRFTAGDQVVVLEAEFPSNFYAWRELADREHGEVVTVARPSDGDWTPAVLESISERTAIVAVCHCHWTDGSLLDLVRIGERAHEVGASFVIDGTQSIGALPFDCATVKPDFVITALYKWLLGPYSSAVMWCAPQHRDGRPLEYSWITREQSDDFPNLVDYRTGYRPGARRYDVGQTSNFALMPAIKAALEQTLGWGVDSIQSYAAELTGKIAAEATAAGLSVAPENLRAGHLLGVHLHGVDVEAVAEAMERANVFVSVRGDAMRVSPHVYNTADDVNRLMAALHSAL